MVRVRAAGGTPGERGVVVVRGCVGGGRRGLFSGDRRCGCRARARRRPGPVPEEVGDSMRGPRRKLKAAAP